MHGIGPKLLKSCVVALYVPIHHLFSLTITNHAIPSEWKCHSITSIHKSGDRTQVTNYRPSYIIVVYNLQDARTHSLRPPKQVHSHKIYPHWFSMWFSPLTLNNTTATLVFDQSPQQSQQQCFLWCNLSGFSAKYLTVFPTMSFWLCFGKLVLATGNGCSGSRNTVLTDTNEYAEMDATLLPSSYILSCTGKYPWSSSISTLCQWPASTSTALRHISLCWRYQMSKICLVGLRLFTAPTRSQSPIHLEYKLKTLL